MQADFNQSIQPSIHQSIQQSIHQLIHQLISQPIAQSINAIHWAMFEVLVYVYENYWQLDACPELPLLGRKLTAVGFEDEEIQAALVWLDGLNIAAQSTQIYLPKTGADSACTSNTSGQLPNMQAQSADSMRGYSIAEQMHRILCARR